MVGHHPKFYHEYDLLNHMYDIVDEDGCILTVLDEDTLKGIPHVETPIIHAHWIVRSAEWRFQIECSKCGMGFEHMTQYCPYCGAKMDEEVE